MKKIFIRPSTRPTIGFLLLLSVMAWAFWLHIPAFEPGYLNAGDDHIHVAYANAAKNIWETEHRPLGWSTLYVCGAPIFLLRPMGLYQFVNLIHAVTGLPIEGSLKILVVLGFCLFPLTMFAGARLLGLGFWPSVMAGLLSPLGISSWGHTIEAYHYLGVHKQLIAILLFPILVGSFWRLLKEGKFGLTYSISFALVFLTHPYMAYCFALLFPVMFFALITDPEIWDWKKGVMRSVLWSIPALCWVSIWLIPFVTSPEMIFQKAYSAGRRDNLEVTVLSAASTLRQYLLGGIFDTSRFSGAFAGPHVWAWLSNSECLRIPLLSYASLLGFALVTFRAVKPVLSFLSLVFCFSLILFIGPDDYPWLDWIPFSAEFQNIHAVFMIEWAVYLTGGFFIAWGFGKAWKIPSPVWRFGITIILSVIIAFSYGTAILERTKSAEKRINVRHVYTTNGRMDLKPEIDHEWRSFKNVVETMAKEEKTGGFASFPHAFFDGMIYNLAPLMADRPYFTCVFEQMGGVYGLSASVTRLKNRTNYELQKLLNIRFVIDNIKHSSDELQRHRRMEKVYSDDYWNLYRVQGDFGELQQLPLKFIAFSGTEKEWSELMTVWIKEVEKNTKNPPWIINLTNADLAETDLHSLQPYIEAIILGKNAYIPAPFSGIRKISIAQMLAGTTAFIEKLADIGKKNTGDPSGSGIILKYKTLPIQRPDKKFHIETTKNQTAVLFKTAFYRGWKAFLNEKAIPIYRVSPGMQMVLIPKGSHVLHWAYTGPNNWKWAKRIFLFGFPFALVLIFFQRKRQQGVKLLQNNTRLEPDESGEIGKTDKAGVPNRIVRTVVLIFIAVLLFQCAQEIILKRPVISRPMWGNQFANGSGYFDWQYLPFIPKGEQRFRVEISRSSDFKDFLHIKTVNINQARWYGTFNQYGPYYFRVRAVIDNKEFAWTRPVKFYGSGEPE